MKAVRKPRPRPGRDQTMHRASPRAVSPPICSTACCAAAARSTSSSDSTSRARDAGGARPRARPRAGRHRAAAARHAAPSAVAASRTRPAAAGAAGRDRAPARRRADSVSRRARPCRGRSLGAAGAGRPVCRALSPGSSTRCCGVSRATAKPRSCRARHADARHARLADGALDRRPTASGTAHAIAAANGQEPALDLTVKERSGSLGGQARRPRASDRLGAHHRPRRGDGAAGLCRRRVVGAGRRGRAAGAACSATSPAGALPISAPRPAARQHSSPPPAHTSPPSTARRRA